MKTKQPRSVFVCSECGAGFSRWQGKCNACGAWNSLQEEKEEFRSRPEQAKPATKPRRLHEIETIDTLRFPSGLSAVDQVLGGGLVKGSLILLGGQPGVGKSTLVLQIAKALDQISVKTLYVSGEESESQIKYRALRLSVSGEHLHLYSETDIDLILRASEQLAPAVMVIDSIQTVRSNELQSVPGSIAQIRECTFRILEYAKSKGVTVLIIGHITKDGELAGPKLLEHMVDTVLQFEGDKQHHFRILRGVKNRFGSTDEVSVLEMREEGLAIIEDPATYFLAETNQTSGSALSILLEGTQPFLVEVQGLVSDNHFTYPRRTALGLDMNRLHLLLAVMEKHAGVLLGQYDVCANLAGGIKSGDPALDLSICMALVSSLRQSPLPKGLLFLGEVGLGGEVRMVSRLEHRVRTALRQGFRNFIVPGRTPEVDATDARIIRVSALADCLTILRNWDES